MGAWSETVPLDHSKFKDIPGGVRDVRTDLGDRLADILYGFTIGEEATPWGLKKGRLLTIGTGAPSQPPGTGSAAAFDTYARANGTGSAIELWGQDKDANEIQLTHKGKVPLDLSARLANNGWLIGRNAADSANVNILKVNTGNAVELASAPVMPGATFTGHPLAPDTAPSADLQYAPKGYVDVAIIAGATALGDWVDKSTDYGAQQATTDGFVTVYLYKVNDATGNGAWMIGYTDANANPTTAIAAAHVFGNYNAFYGGFSFPVKKNHYWKCVLGGSVAPTTLAVRWIPLGS